MGAPRSRPAVAVNTMRILYAHNNVDLYGSSRSLLRLTSRLVADGHEVRVLLPGDGPLLRALERSGVTVSVDDALTIIDRRSCRTPRDVFKLLAGLPHSARRVMRLIDEFGPAQAHTNTSVVLSLAVAARRRRVPHIWHIREFYGEFRAFWWLYQWFMATHARKIACVSAAVARQFSIFIRRRKTRVLHNGFPVEEFQPVIRERVEVFRARVGVSEEQTLVGVVGRVKLRRKGQETFVRAAGLLAPRHPDVRFLIIGSPYAGNEPHVDELKRLAEEDGVPDRVIFTGDIADIRAAYAALEIVVLSSGQPEPFGGVVIEAMAMGKPVVGTRVGGTVEQIEDGRTGRLVPPSDPHAMANAVEELLGDPEQRRAMGAAGRQRYLRLFEFEAFYRRMLALYGIEKTAGQPN